MPRVTSRRVETPELQGEGSFVVFRKLSHGAVKEVRRFMVIGDVKERKDLTVEQIDEMIAKEEMLTLELVSNGIAEWNWQDENGNPLPIPKTTEDLDKMTDEEVQYIVMGCIGQLPQDQQQSKN